MRCRGAILVVVLTVAVAASAQPTDVRVLLLVNPPYTMVSDDGSPRGFLPNLFATLRVPGFRWKLEVVPWARALADTRYDDTGLVLLPTLTRTPEREALFHWIAPIQEPRYFFIGRAPVDPGLSLTTLKTKAVGVLLANSSDDWLKRNGFTRVEEVSSLQQMLKMLLSGRVDYLLKDVSSLAFLVQSNGLAAGSLELGPEVKELALPLYVAGGPSLDPTLEREVRAALEQLRRDGTMEKLWDQSQSQ